MKTVAKVRLDLAFVGDGRLEGSLTLDGATYPLGASYSEDTPAQLLGATRAAVLGGQCDVAWFQGPGADVWRLQAADSTLLRLTVDEVASWPRIGWSPGSDAAAHLVPRLAWLRAVIRAMSVLGQDQERYETQWRRPFPAASVRAAQELLAKERAEG